ncbi:MAG: hypothetical protein K2O18_19690 [Oscillospiraceae bacterium]|nr:hypothetical protein [Oscillospiraceae bacterium]
MNEYYQRFIGSRQESLRLTIALERFIQAEGEEREAYIRYLHRRLQPAATALIAAGDTARLAELAKMGWFTEKQTDGMIAQAQKEKKNAALVWLLRWKGEQYGFRDRDFSL